MGVKMKNIPPTTSTHRRRQKRITNAKTPFPLGVSRQGVKNLCVVMLSVDFTLLLSYTCAIREKLEVAINANDGRIIQGIRAEPGRISEACQIIAEYRT